MLNTIIFEVTFDNPPLGEEYKFQLCQNQGVEATVDTSGSTPVLNCSGKLDSTGASVNSYFLHSVVTKDSITGNPYSKKFSKL